MTAIVNHEWDEDGDCAISVQQDLPNWRFSLVEIVGIVFKTFGGYANVTAQGLTMVGLELQAAAEYRRRVFAQRQDEAAEEAARAEMAASLEGIVYSDLGDDQ